MQSLHRPSDTDHILQVGGSLLHVPFFSGHYEGKEEVCLHVVEALLKHGVDVHQKSREVMNHTPAIYACLLYVCSLSQSRKSICWLAFFLKHTLPHVCVQSF